MCAIPLRVVAAKPKEDSMTVRRRGKAGRWQYDFMIRRVRYKGSIPEAKNKQDALAVEAQMRQAVFEGRYGRQARSVTLEQFIKDVFLPYAKTNRKQWEQDEKHCNGFTQFFKGRALQEIPPMLIEQYKRGRRDSVSRLGKPRKASSINYELSVLCRIFNLAVENGYINQNPVDKVRRLKQSDKRERVMSYDEELLIRQQLKSEKYAHLFPVFELILNTGMRITEALELKWNEIDLKAAEIRLPDFRTKEHRDKTIPLNPTALGVLAQLHSETDVDVFGTGFERSYVERRWRELCKDAGVSDLRIHDLRHTFATRLGEDGIMERTISAILGHSTVKMTAKYIHIGEEAKRKAVEKLCTRIVSSQKEKVG
jgi:integrase